MSESRPYVESTPLPLTWLVTAAWAGALIAALLFSSQIFFSMIDHGHDYWRLVLWQAVLWGFWAAVSPWVLHSGVELLRPQDRPRHWLVKLAGLGALLTALHLVVGAAALFLLQPYVPVASYSYLEALNRIWAAWVGVSPVVFGVLVATGYGVGGFVAARRRELRASVLEGELVRAQLQALRLEIQPHFLFNTLNSIAALVRSSQNEQALEMLLKLSELLRSTLDHSGGPLVSLQDELDFVKRYLDLQAIRFADRLEVEYSIPSECLDKAMPFLLLQPLAENAIQHGLARRAGGGKMEIAAELSNGDLILTVSDDGPGLPEEFDADTAGGLGLSNTRLRLMKIYQDRAASIEVESRSGGGTTARVVIPQDLATQTLERAEA